MMIQPAFFAARPEVQRTYKLSRGNQIVVLESFITPLKAENQPWIVAGLGFLFAIAAMPLAWYLFKPWASMVTVFLITAASIPLLYNIIRFEEDKDAHELKERVLIKEHGKAVMAYFMLFVGVTLGLTAGFFAMPQDMVLASFDAQIQTYQSINPTAQIQGAATEVTGNATSMRFFTRILLNNMRVLMWCIVFSFLYGAGAVLILVWNASVLALAIGNTIRTKMAELAIDTGLSQIGAYFAIGAHTIFLRYGIHGSLEIIAYMIAGLAGGIISVAAIRHHFSTRKFEHIVIDSTDLILLSIAVLFLAGVVEAFVTPIFY